MNILRELRRLKKKSLRLKLWLILILLIMLISSIYAWSFMQSRGRTYGLEGVVNSWGIEFYVQDEEILDEYITFTAEEFYPGMADNHQIVTIHNIGQRPSTVSIEVKSIKLFGEEVYDELMEDNEIKVNGTRLNMFTDKEKYPFDVYIDYDNYLEGKPAGKENEKSIGQVEFCVLWKYEEIKDILDTEFGKNAYKYYNEDGELDLETIKNAIEVSIRIKAEATNF